jgi:hypothetical protein
MDNDNNRNRRTPAWPAERDLQQVDVRTYSLETIMALQKALESGITPEETLPRPKSRLAEPERVIASDIQSSLIARFSKSLAEMGRGLGQALRSAVGFKKRSKHTSAR